MARRTARRSAPRRRPPASTRYCFTFNNYEAKDPHWREHVESLMERAVYFACQEEIGEGSGTPHLQGAVEFATRSRPTEMNIFQGGNVLTEEEPDADTERRGPGVWWSKMRAPGFEAYRYCLKEDSRKPGGLQWQKALPAPPRALQRYTKDELRPWQRRVYDVCCTPPARDDRTVRWYWEATGGVGKSFLVKTMYDEDDFTVISVSGKATDIFFAVKAFIEEHKEGPDVVIVDVPRVMGDHVSYQAIEKIKDGLLFSGKYEGGTIRFNTPHVLVFSNQPPERENFSVDRWHVRELVGLELLGQLGVDAGPTDP